MTTVSQRARFLECFLELMHSPYRWGGKGEVKSYGQAAFDCSGAITYAFLKAGGPDWRATHGSAALLAKCRRVKEAQPGTVVVYGDPKHAGHVMVHVGAGVVVGASGGGSKTDTLAEALAGDAKVKAYPTLDYRKDRVAMVELPFPDELGEMACAQCGSFYGTNDACGACRMYRDGFEGRPGHET